jgi:ubiquinone/menaquinone biosynthesis C-methylase UbiE
MTDRRADTIWQDARVTAAYHASRTGIPFAAAHLDILNRILAGAGIPVRRILDLGAGDGFLTAAVARRWPLAEAVLVDFSQPMLDAAKQRLAQASFATTFITGDFRETGWHAEVQRASPFDAVVSRFAIHHIPDDMKRAVYASAYEWLTPGGMFVNIEHVASASPLYEGLNDDWMIEGILASRAGQGDVENVTRTYRERLDSGANILAPLQDQLDWLAGVGFVDVDCAFKAFELAVFAGRRPAAGNTHVEG